MFDSFVLLFTGQSFGEYTPEFKGRVVDVDGHEYEGKCSIIGEREEYLFATYQGNSISIKFADIQEILIDDPAKKNGSILLRNGRRAEVTKMRLSSVRVVTDIGNIFIELKRIKSIQFIEYPR